MNPIDFDLERVTLLTRAQAAQELGVTTRTIDYHHAKGNLTPYISPVGHGLGGTRVFFRREEIEALKRPRVQKRMKAETST